MQYKNTMHHNTYKKRISMRRFSFFLIATQFYFDKKLTPFKDKQPKHWRVTMIRRAAFELSTTTHCPSSEEKSHS